MIACLLIEFNTTTVKFRCNQFYFDAECPLATETERIELCEEIRIFVNPIRSILILKKYPYLLIFLQTI